MKKLKPKNRDVELAVGCKHLLLTSLKPLKIYEVSVKDESTFMCPQCYKHNKMFKDIEDGLTDDWVTMCKCCILRRFKKIEAIMKVL